MTEESEERIKLLREVAGKIETSLQATIGGHVGSTEFAPKQGLDFLDCKNSVLLSYLIDLTFWLRCQLAGESVPSTCLHRLIEMRTILDKIRVLDKKLRYQIDKLLAVSQIHNEELAQGGEDPLLYRPHVTGEEDEDEASESSDGSDDNEEMKSRNEGLEAEDDLDEDLASARLTLALAQERKIQKKGKHSERGDDEDDGIYHAPRHAAVPYMLESNKEERRQKRRLQQLQASEVAESIRHQYSETPEQEDSHGAAMIGKQRASSRRLAEQEAQRTSFEEDNMIRLTVTRKEKKARKKMLREETSNLHAISDLGNLVNEATLTRGSGRGKKNREFTASPGKLRNKPRAKSGPKNSLAAALVGQEKSTKKKKRS